MASQLSERDQRTLKYGAIAVGLYLACFLGWRGWHALEKQKQDYAKLLGDAQALSTKLKPYQDKVAEISNLMQRFQFDPSKLTHETLVSQASAAIQNAAQSNGIKLGPMRESAAHGGGRELASMQLQGTGQISGVMAMLHGLTSIGYPLVIDSVQINPEPAPGMVKVNLTIIIMDFDQWKAEEAPHA